MKEAKPGTKPPTRPGTRPGSKTIAAPSKLPRHPSRAATSQLRKRRGNALAPERIAALLHALDQAYPNAECALVHSSAWELLVATILSAQCTDARVNMVTPGLFRKYPTPADFASADPLALQEDIRPTGFFRNKTKSVMGAAQKLISDFRGQVPQTLAQLLTLPGVARKTGNVVLGVAFGHAEGVVVDTHVMRLSQRLELTTATDPKNIEQDLMRLIPQSSWIAFSHQLIHHGRQVCLARKPRCAGCTLEPLCYSRDKTWSSHPG